ncbi:hypothetical protein LCGC14_1849770 [marine sediment metagenome]|uniref:Alpha-D-phosphohexomutase alpha/beta/alpha domain-containing protein n=1 Tax=marine sediment metagenome TaxID=412755 RepID=A0A0F9GZ07_9ZZZZ
MGADLGVVFDGAAERIILVDELAREIQPDVALRLLLHLVARHAPRGGRVVLPTNVSRLAERAVQGEGLEVVRSGTNASSLMAAAAADGVVFAGSPDGGFIFPSFIPGFDAIMSVAKVLELLALEAKPLSALCAAVPAASLVHEQAPVPWSLKGLAMRELGERVREIRVEPADGIRVEEDGGWAQLVPDPDEPLFHIYAEGRDGSESRRLAGHYRALIEEVLAEAET